MDNYSHIQRYTKYVNEALYKVDIDTATYKDHLHKIFEWIWCIFLTNEYHSIFLRWEDIPPDEREKKGMMRDMGIDALDSIGNRVIQMKCYQGVISWRCISTFLACCSLQFKDASKILCRTSESSLHSMIQIGITNGDILDKTITDSVFRTECKRIQTLQFNPIVPTEQLSIRPYQEQSIDVIQEGKHQSKNVYLNIPTGCGKTFILLTYHKTHLDEITLVLVPTIVLLEQWGKECKHMDIHCFLIGTGQHHNLDDHKYETIVVCVYNSIVNIRNDLHRFNRYVIDEAHHVKIPERYMDNDNEFSNHYDEFDSDEDEFDSKEDEDFELKEDEDEFDSKEDEDFELKDEEEKSYTSYINSLSDTKKVIYMSATLDNPEDDSLFYEYHVRQAITEGYLCDYQFVFPIFEQDDVTNQQLAYYLVHKQQETHCVVYASSCEEGKKFKEQLNQLRHGCAGYIDADTSYKERHRLFEEFESGHIQFLVNVRVLVEGFNAPHIRSIFFLHVSSNEMFVIQAIGRSLRLHPDKILATIYVPFTSENDFDRIQTFISQLSTYDERIKDSISEKKIGGYIRLENMSEIQDDDEDEEKENTVFEYRYNLVVDSMGKSNKFEEIWIRNLEQCKVYMDENKKRPSKKDKDKNVGYLVKWITNQINTYKKQIYIMKVETIRQRWKEFITDEKYKQYFMTNEEEWISKLERCKDYIDTNDKRPSQTDKNDDVKNLGIWLTRQITNYKKQNDIMKDETIRKQWKEFITDAKYKVYFITGKEVWIRNLEQCKVYMDENKKRPSKTDKDKNVNYLGQWMSQQTKNYKKQIYIMKDDAIRQKWEEFITDDKYKVYFK